MMKIYHNSRCRKSRAGLEYLQSKGVDFEIVEYLKNPPGKEELTQLVNKMDLTAAELIRKQENIFKSEYKGKSLSDEEWIDAMVAHPKLIQRPIVETASNAVLAQPPENIDKLI